MTSSQSETWVWTQHCYAQINDKKLHGSERADWPEKFLALETWLGCILYLCLKKFLHRITLIFFFTVCKAQNWIICMGDLHFEQLVILYVNYCWRMTREKFGCGNPFFFMNPCYTLSNELRRFMRWSGIKLILIEIVYNEVFNKLRLGRISRRVEAENAISKISNAHRNMIPFLKYFQSQALHSKPDAYLAPHSKFESCESLRFNESSLNFCQYRSVRNLSLVKLGYPTLLNLNQRESEWDKVKIHWISVN